MPGRDVVRTGKKKPITLARVRTIAFLTIGGGGGGGTHVTDRTPPPHGAPPKTAGRIGSPPPKRFPPPSQPFAGRPRSVPRRPGLSVFSPSVATPSYVPLPSAAPTDTTAFSWPSSKARRSDRTRVPFVVARRRRPTIWSPNTNRPWSQLVNDAAMYSARNRDAMITGKRRLFVRFPTIDPIFRPPGDTKHRRARAYVTVPWGHYQTFSDSRRRTYITFAGSGRNSADLQDGRGR